MQILVSPSYSDWLQNRLFEPKDPLADHWHYPLFKWREVAKTHGIQIDTWDMRPLSQANLIWMQDLPKSREEIIACKKAAPGIPFVLQHYESPLDREYFHDPNNHKLFDAIVTFNHHLCDERRYFHYHLPIGKPDFFPQFKSFSQRNLLVMINTNRYSGFLAPRQSELSGLPAIGPYLGGWKLSWQKILQRHRLDLYQRRRSIARLAEQSCPDVLDIYGAGWQGEANSWIHKIFPTKPFKCALGKTTLSKLETLSQYRFCLAFENMVGNYGYISEKIFDCFYAGVVPIYLGDTDINKYVPKEVFVDARQFKTNMEILDFVTKCPESTWKKMHEAGQTFLTSDQIKTFQTDAFVMRMLTIIGVVRNTLKPSPYKSSISY